MKKKKTSFFLALISKEARLRRNQEIQEEKKLRRKVNAHMEAGAFSWFFFMGGIALLPGNWILGVLALLASYAWYRLIYLISYNHGPLVKGGNTFRRDGRQAIHYGPRGGKYRMSADGKRRIYF